MIDVAEADDALPITRIGAYQLAILAIGALTLFADGFDAQMVGYVAPAISAEWHVTPKLLAPVFSANVFGLMLGAMSITAIADMIGRKYVTVACVGIFALMSLLTVATTRIQSFTLIRFASGLALGGAMPCIIAAASDYFPARYRTRLAVLLATSWSAGIFVCGLVTGALVETRGWRSLFVIGGVLPLLLTVPLLLVPESPSTLIRRGQRARLKAILHRIDPTVEADLPPSIPRRARFPVASLFANGWAPITLLVWLAYFCAGATIYFFLNWLPIFVNQAGYGVSRAAYVTAMYQGGSLIGGLGVGVLIDRRGSVGLAVALAGAACAVTTLGFSAGSLALTAGAAMLAGALVAGSQNAANAYVGSGLYPSHIRATGLGWALGSVRLSGALAGSFGAGFLLDLKMGSVATLMIIAIPEVMAAMAYLGVAAALRRRKRAYG